MNFCLDVCFVMALTAMYSLSKNTRPKNKYNTPVNEVELLKANRNYVLIQQTERKEPNVSIRDLIPAGGVSNPQEGIPFLSL